MTKEREGSAVIVTGAGGGMGRAAVRRLCELGFRVFALDLNAPEDSAEQPLVKNIRADVTDQKSLDRAFEVVSAECERVLGILHFAGIYMLDSLIEMSEDAFRKIFDVNLHGAFLVNKTFMPLLRRGSRIVITTSELAPLDPLPFTGIYAVTKAALDKYAYSLRMELQLLGIGVSVLRAGAVSTDMLGVSTAALDRFCESTRLYSCNAKRFKGIVESVEARSITTDKLAKRAVSILLRKKPRFAYAINRNPLLLLLNALPKRLQLFAIRKILK